MWESSKVVTRWSWWRQTRSAPTKVFRRLAVNKTILKALIAAAKGDQYVYAGFSRRNKIPCYSAYMILEKAMRFWHTNYNVDQAENLISCPCPDICRHATFHANPCMCFWVISLTDRQTYEHEQKHVPPPLSKVITRSVAAGLGRHSMLPPACNDTGIAFCFPNEEEAEMRRA